MVGGSVNISSIVRMERREGFWGEGGASMLIGVSGGDMGSVIASWLRSWGRLSRWLAIIEQWGALSLLLKQLYTFVPVVIFGRLESSFHYE